MIHSFIPPTLSQSVKGFTLIELSIVLVIIGLIVGGILVGQNLISAAAVRAQITQIEKYNSAANTFRGKYGYLPGDIKDPDASRLGFLSRGTIAGEGDGNGVIEGENVMVSPGLSQISETTMFWVDLSTAHMMEDTFNTVTPTASVSAPTNSPLISLVYPAAKIGNGNSIYVWSTGGVNYFGLSTVTQINNTLLCSNPVLTVKDAYSIDKKVDDGLPQSGNVMAWFVNFNVSSTLPIWAHGNTTGISGCGSSWDQGTNNNGGPSTLGTLGSSTTCYDNSNGSGPQQYSLAQNGGMGQNCALSFRFQ